MPNIGTMTASMTNLWREEAFRGFFSPNDSETEGRWAELMQQLEAERRVLMRIPQQDFVRNMRKHVPEHRLRELYKSDFLDGSKQYPPIEAVLELKEPADSVTTLARYSPDTRIAQALAEIFPERDIRCSWFIDGAGDYGSFTLRGQKTLNAVEGNLQEDLEACANMAQKGAEKDES